VSAPASPPRWRWDQSAGALYGPDGRFVAGGYSGRGSGLNNPEAEHIRATGPIPRGLWEIGPEQVSARTGRHMDLTPVRHSAHGRSAFQIHGDNRSGNRTASSGCIILAPAIRALINRSMVKLLEVTR
jgi:hypothetical protein